MKKCPFCAEEIQDEAIKCRFCNSFLSAPPPGVVAQPGAGPASGGVAAAPAAAVATSSGGGEAAGAPAPWVRAAGRDAVPAGRTTIYEGVPSWKAFFRHYLLAVIIAGLAAAGVVVIATTVPIMTRALYAAIPVAAMLLYFLGVNLYRRSIRFRVTNTVIETERGFLSRRIDVLQLWRCRDVRYKQSLSDRMLGIAHIEVFAHDATTPHFEIVGMPASRQLFEQLRDSIELQRQHKNVYGVVS